MNEPLLLLGKLYDVLGVLFLCLGEDLNDLGLPISSSLERLAQLFSSSVLIRSEILQAPVTLVFLFTQMSILSAVLHLRLTSSSSSFLISFEIPFCGETLSTWQLPSNLKFSKNFYN